MRKELTVMKKINKLSKLLSIGMSVLLLVVLLESMTYIVTHFEHNCTGEECPICRQIRMAEAVLNEIGTAVNPFLQGIFYAIFFTCTCLTILIFLCVNTLISRKVRLND